jgi:hypothetical protein
MRKWPGKWNGETRRSALEWFSQQRATDVFIWVPVSKGGWRGWPSDADEHTLDGVAAGAGKGSVRDWDEDEFASVVGGPLQPILAWGYADRPALGEIVATTAMLARSFPGHGLIRPLVLVSMSEAESNTASAYAARGIELVVVPDEVLP